jgi:hypothetical protein
MKVNILRLYFNNRSKTQLVIGTDNPNLEAYDWVNMPVGLVNSKGNILYPYALVPSDGVSYYYGLHTWVYVKTVDIPTDETNPNKLLIDPNNTTLMDSIYPTLRVDCVEEWLFLYDIIKLKKRTYLGNSDTHQTWLSDILRQTKTELKGKDQYLINEGHIKDAKHWERNSHEDQLFRIVSILEVTTIFDRKLKLYEVSSIKDTIVLRIPVQAINLSHGIFTGSSIIKEKWHYVQ